MHNQRKYTYRIYTERGVIYGEGYSSKEEAAGALAPHLVKMKNIRENAAGIVGTDTRKVFRSEISA